jgi:tetratricopeptide (TPR) repeat protein
MRIPLFTFFILHSSFCFAQSKLIGFVREQNTGIKIAGVKVNSNGFSNPVASTGSGDFILIFQDLKPGKNIIIQAEKEGWELVNEKQMSTLIPENPYEKHFKIILCKAGTLAKARSEYYETFDLNLQNELAKQKALNRGNEKKIASLEQDFARVKQQLNDLADEYSRIDLRDASEKDLKAIELFKEGKYDEFIALKNSMVTEAQVDKAIKSKVEATKTIANNDSTINLYLKSQKDIANTLVLQFKFEEAEKTYEIMVSKDTTSFENVFSFARFLQQQNLHGRAILTYRRALKLTKGDFEIAATQNNLGILYQATNDYPAALNAYDKTIEIYERLAKTNPASYKPNVARTQNNLGVLYNAQNDYPAALNAYGKALEIYERLAKTNPASYETDVAMSQNNLGILYKAQNDYPAALNAYGKTLEIYERLAKTNPASYEPYVATTQNNLGTLYHEKNDYPAALNAYVKALEIRERLAKTNPASYEPDVAATQTNLGTLYLAKYDYPAALNAYGKALEIYERLTKTNPVSYVPYVAMTQNNLGTLYKAQNDYLAALNAYGKALEIRERLANTNPASYEPYVATTQNNLGALYHEKNDYPAALNAYGKALEIRERLAKTNPTTYEPDVATIQNNLGVLYVAKNDYPAALNACGKALEIYERLAKINPDKYEIEFCRSIVLLGLLQKADYQENRQMTIAKYLSKAKQILLKYAELPLVKQLLGNVKDLDIYFNDKKNLLLIEALQNEIEKTDNFNEKIKIQEKIIQHYRSLVNTSHKNFTYDLGASLSSLAWYYLFEKKFSVAEKAAREALNPTNFSKAKDYDEKIEWANTNLALALLFQGKYAEAEKIYTTLKDKPYNEATYKDTFFADFDELEKAGIIHPDVIKIKTLLKK